MSKRTHADALKTKKKILDAASKVFAEQGFNKASLSNIAREAQVTRGAIYWHFENKNELLASLVEEEAHRLNLVHGIRAASEDNQRDPLGRLKTWMFQHFTDQVEQELLSSSLMDILESIISSKTNEDARNKLLELIRERRFRIEEALRAAIGRNQLPADLDIEAAAAFLQSLLWGLTHNLRIGLGVKPSMRYVQLIDAAFMALPHMRRSNTTEANKALLNSFNALNAAISPNN